MVIDKRIIDFMKYLFAEKGAAQKDNLWQCSYFLFDMTRYEVSELIHPPLWSQEIIPISVVSLICILIKMASVENKVFIIQIRYF
jgi:hypothetical protein